VLLASTVIAPAGSGALNRTVITFVGLLAAAATVAVLVRRLPIPYVTALAIAGAALGSLASHYQPHVTSSLILFIVLPGLLFESAFNLRWARLRRDLVPVVLLATLGVAVTMAVIALLGHATLGLSVPIAILLGAAVAPTDPVAVVAVFRRLGVPRRLGAVIEAESLLNDGTGVVAFSIALAAATGGSLGAGDAILSFLRLAGGGLALGTAVGFVLSLLTSRIDDSQVELTFTAIGAYGTYVLGEALQVSGILAVVAAAIVLGNYGRSHGMSERTRAAIDSVWGYAAFVLNSLIFLLIGLSTPVPDVFARIGAVIAAAVIAVVARAVAVYLLLFPVWMVRRAMPWHWQHVVVWSGMRGAVAVALVLSLTESGSGFSEVRTLVYGVVLFSIIFQGASIGPLTAWLIPAEQRVPAGEAPPRAQSPSGWLSGIPRRPHRRGPTAKAGADSELGRGHLDPARDEEKRHRDRPEQRHDDAAHRRDADDAD
jgi:CPA1 family monovalent cation:H+ antiporter